MASAATIMTSKPESPKVHALEISSTKTFAESNGASPIPSTYHSLAGVNDEVADELAAFIPVIDLSLLTSNDPQIHAKAVHELGKACAEWGVFLLTNHGIPENLIEEVMNKSHEFHELPDEVKKKFDHVDIGYFTPIKYRTSYNFKEDQFYYWRDYLKVITSPEFNFPNKPPGFRETTFDFTRKVIAIMTNLLRGISESLGLESNSIIESTGFDSPSQFFAANLYPPCPQPHLAQGLPPHSDQGLLTLIMQNGIGGLQVKRDGKWVNINPLAKSLVIVVGDQTEVVTNGRYTSSIHRVILNNSKTRISVVVFNGPALDKEIGPARELLEKEKAVFKSYKFRDYSKFVEKTRPPHKGGFGAIRLNVE